MSHNILNILDSTAYEDDAVVRLDFHSHLPFTNSTFNNNNEIRIPFHQQDVYTFPCERYIHIKFEYTNNADDNDATHQLVSSAVAHLFDEIRYEITGAKIDRVKNVGITITIKNMLTIKPHEIKFLENAAWTEDLYSTFTLSWKDISFCVPLKMLLGFVEDFKRILLNVKQELVLIRASNDNNAIKSPLLIIINWQ